MRLCLCVRRRRSTSPSSSLSVISQTSTVSSCSSIRANPAREPGRRRSAGSGRWRAGFASRCSPRPTTVPRPRRGSRPPSSRSWSGGIPPPRSGSAARMPAAGSWTSPPAPRSSPPTTPTTASTSGATPPAYPGRVFWKDSRSRDQILKRTEYYQPTPQLGELVEASRAHPVVIVTGEAGVGKSTLAAALARPEVTDGLVPPGFAHAIALLDAVRPTSAAWPSTWNASSSTPSPGFPGPSRSSSGASRSPQRQMDRLPGPDGPATPGLPDRPAPGPDRPRRLRSAPRGHAPRGAGCPPAIPRPLSPGDHHPRRHARVPAAGTRSAAAGPTAPTLGRYLASRRVPEGPREAILDAGPGPLADRPTAGGCRPGRSRDRPGPPAGHDRRGVRGAPGPGRGRCRRRLADAIRPRARAAGRRRVRARSCRSPCWSTRARTWMVRTDAGGIRDVLAALRGLVVRGDPGTPGEQDGLFHPTLAEYLLGTAAASAGFEIDARGHTRALAQAIEALAPVSDHDPDDPLHRYAFLREADHWWAIGDVDRTLAVSEQPRVERSEGESRPLAAVASPRFRNDSARMIRSPSLSRGSIAAWTGETGDAAAALRLFQDLLPDQERVLGRDHPDTLMTRNNIAVWTGETGDARGGVAAVPGPAAGPGAGAGPRPPRHAHDPQQHRGLDRRDGRRARRRCGCSRPCCRTGSGCWAATTPTRSRPATTSRPGPARRAMAAEALRLSSRPLLPDQERVLGRDHPDTLTTRNNIAAWTGKTGDAREALRLSPGPAAGPGAGAGPRPPRHAQDPQQHRGLDRRDGRRAGRRCGCSRPCCRTRSGCWAATTPTRSPPSDGLRSGPSEWRPGGRMPVAA